MTNRTLVTGESCEPLSTVVNNRASIPGAPLASKAMVASLSGARCSGCCAGTVIAHNAIKIIPVSNVDGLNIALLFESRSTSPPARAGGTDTHPLTQVVLTYSRSRPQTHDVCRNCRAVSADAITSIAFGSIERRVG